MNEKLAARLTAAGMTGNLAATVANARIVHLSSFTGASERRLQEELAEKLDDNVVLSLNPGAIYAGLGADRITTLLRRANVIFLYEQQLERLLENSSSRVTYAPDRIAEKVAAFCDWRGKRGSDQPLALVVKRPANLHLGTNEAYLCVGYGVTTMADLTRA